MLHIFISFIFFCIIVLIILRHYKRGDYYIRKSDLCVYILLFILFGTFGGGEGDYLHYKETVEEYNTLQDVLFFTGMEKQYVYLSYLVGGNYNLWRFILFSVEFIGLGFFLYKAKLNTYPILLSFTTLCLVTSIYGRASWGNIFYFMGVYLLIEKKNPLYLIAIALSYVSHTSYLVLIALLPLAFVNIKKQHLLLFLIFFGFLVAIFKEQFTNLLNSGGFDYDGAEYINDRLQKYGEGGTKAYFGRSIGETITIVLRDFFVLSVMYSILKLMFSNGSGNSYLSIYKPVRSVVNICIGIVLLSTIILMASIGSAPLFYRVFDMSVFFISIILPCLYQIKLVSKRRFDIYIRWFIFYSIFGYLRDLYYAYAGGIY